ncbi:MAG: hypothetical protein IKE25_12850 [Clostridia bacterium]|nr:hypothetical protein [Clostridia bacterium]
MYRELNANLTYMYSVICRGKGRLPDSDLRHIANGAHSMTRSAPVVETLTKTETENDKQYLKEAQKIDQQIEEMAVFLMSLEIV